MEFQLFCKRTIIGALLAAATTAAGASDKTIIESIKAMEQELGVTITTPNELIRGVQRVQQIPGLLPPAISPDGTALVWWSVLVPNRDEKIPILSVNTLKEGKQVVPVEGRMAFHCLGVSSGAEVIVATARRLGGLQMSPWELLVIGRRGVVVHVRQGGSWKVIAPPASIDQWLTQTFPRFYHSAVSQFPRTARHKNIVTSMK